MLSRVWFTTWGFEVRLGARPCAVHSFRPSYTTWELWTPCRLVFLICSDWSNLLRCLLRTRVHAGNLVLGIPSSCMSILRVAVVERAPAVSPKFEIGLRHEHCSHCEDSAVRCGGFMSQLLSVDVRMSKSIGGDFYSHRARAVAEAHGDEHITGAHSAITWVGYVRGRRKLLFKIDIHSCDPQ